MNKIGNNPIKNNNITKKRLSGFHTQVKVTAAKHAGLQKTDHINKYKNTISNNIILI